MFDEQEFDQAIEAIRSFSIKLRATAETLKGEADNCACNMDGDNAANNAATNLKKVMDRIEEILDTQVSSLISKLEAEKERAKRMAQDTEE